MKDKEILNILFEDAGIRHSALLSENICIIEKYLDIGDEQLSSILWVDEDGSYIQMITEQEIDNIIFKRDLYLEGVEQEKQRKKIESVALQFRDKPIIRNLLKYFVSSQQAANIARSIQSIENLKTNSTLLNQALINVSEEEREDIDQFLKQRVEWNAYLLKKILNQVETLTGMLLLLGKINNQSLSISESHNYLVFKRFLLKNWFQIQENPHLFRVNLQNSVNSIFCIANADIQIINIFESLFSLKAKYFDIALLLLKEIIVVKELLSETAKTAIKPILFSENQFLFRSLFLSFPEAREFALEEKINSSLENKYGNLFEDLMIEFRACRGIFDGGVDVVVGREAFDIKSGPAVMNKSMVDAFAAKQKLIQQQRLLPDISTYKIALGYGKREKLNSFMKKIDTEILTGRQAWTKITGVEYSPEIVFAIAGFVARIFGCKSIVNSILTSGEKYVCNAKDDAEFTQFLASTFDQINLTSTAQQEIDFIDSLLRA